MDCRDEPGNDDGRKIGAFEALLRKAPQYEGYWGAKLTKMKEAARGPPLRLIW